MTKNILVIDDEESVRKAFLLALEDGDYQVTAAESGEHGLLAFQQQAYDLIFLDLRMPGMNGVETLRQLREKNQTVPVYIVTAFHKEYLDELNEAKAAGMAFELLDKPIGQDEISHVVEGVLVHAD